MIFGRKKKDDGLLVKEKKYFLVFYVVMLENNYNFGVYKKATEEPFVNMRESVNELRDYYEKQLKTYNLTINISNIIRLTEEEYLFADAEEK